MFSIKPLKKPDPKAQPPKKHNAFAAAMEDDKPSINPVQSLSSKVPLLLSEMSKQSHSKMLDETSKLLMEDPNIYDYDAHYDDIATKRVEIAEQKKEKKESRYIENIIRHSEKRKIEQTIVKEKIAEKELKREGADQNAQKYVTKGYLKMQEQNKKFLEEDAAKEAYNAAHAASTEDGMIGLYQNLFKNDTSLGGHRPDLANMKKEVNEVKTTTVVQPNQNIVQASEKVSATQENRNIPEQAADKIKMDIVDGQKEKSRDRRSPERAPAREERRKEAESRSRSRSREKSPLRIPTPKEEIKSDKPEVKEMSKEDKLKAAKERFMARKLNQNTGNQEVV